jgi:hypothetical protein
MTTKDQIALAKLYMENSDMSSFETEAPYRNDGNDFDSGDVEEIDLNTIHGELMDIAIRLEDSGMFKNENAEMYGHLKAVMDMLVNHPSSKSSNPNDYVLDRQ